MPHPFKSEADVMFGPCERKIVVRGERHVVHEERPRISIAQLIGIAPRDADNRSATFADIFAVSARNAKNLASHIGPVLEPGHCLSLTGPPDQAVIKKRR